MTKKIQKIPEVIIVTSARIAVPTQASMVRALLLRLPSPGMLLTSTAEPLVLDKKQEGIGLYTPYSPALDIKLENGSESESESNGENLYLNLADDTPSPKPSPAVKGKKPEDLKKGMKKPPKEDELTVMIKKANADILKNILVEHSMDHRSHMLSYVTGRTSYPFYLFKQLGKKIIFLRIAGQGNGTGQRNQRCEGQSARLER